VGAGFRDSKAIKSDGTLWTWGWNLNRQHSPIKISCHKTDTIDPLLPETWSIFPNPGNELVTLQGLKEDASSLMYQISNCLGKVVVPQQLLPDSREINILSLSPGVYFLTFIKEKGYVTRPFVKM
jgi:hypothetical protein